MRELTYDELNLECKKFNDYVTMAGIPLDIFAKMGIVEKLSSAACCTSEDTGCSYPGSFLVHVNYVTALALRMANMVSATFDIDIKSLVKCCIIQHLAKTIMIVPNDNQWEVTKRGENNKFVNLQSRRLKCGARSLNMIQGLGVHISEVEQEAITCIDRGLSDSTPFDNIMTTIIRHANEMAYAIERKKYGKI